MKPPSPTAQPSKSALYEAIAHRAGYKPSKRPKLFWYCRTPEGWRYYPADRPGVREFPGRLVVRENVNGKRVYTPVNGDDATSAQTAVSAAETRGIKAATSDTVSTLAKAIDEYIENRKQHRKLEAAENARVVLNEFMATLPTVKTVRGISKEHLSQFVTALHERGQSDRTVSNKYNRVRSFLKFAEHDIKLSKDDRPKYEKKLPTVYTKAEVTALMTHADQYMKIALTMGMQLGLREQELMHAEFSDIDHDHKTFRVRSKPQYEFKVKDSEERDVPIPSALLALLDKWQTKRKRTNLILGIGKEYKVPNGHLLRWLQRVAKNARVEDATLHKMRRYYVTTLLRSGAVDLRTVQAFAGHSDLASTMRYLKPASAQELQSKLDTIF
jgi:integrase